MRAWAISEPGPIATSPLRRVDREPPRVKPTEIRIRVEACGVCRTDLHLAEGDLAPHVPQAVPGHEVVGVVDEAGAGCRQFGVGDRAGIAWLRYTCGQCHACRTGAENLCPNARFTGWDADGGFAEWATIDEAYAYHLPARYDAAHAAPLLCAGIIGYRALERASVPPNGRLGIYGFGASAHLTAQVAMARGARVHVMTRSEAAREHARELGVASVAAADAPPPEPLDAAILFAPVGTLVPPALEALADGGTLAIAGIHLSDIPSLNYDRHLFRERQIRSVTANTRRDGTEFLALAAKIPLQVRVQPYQLDEADVALRDLAADHVTGAAVLLP
ncbi:MAG TPA: zinc-dependent alcohol dehydrogenase family protein [Acidimicrobiia bacterium]|nr:zinc-dependent alcohol dehydrogenase family protein [Acidimicrobiia bacterium]